MDIGIATERPWLKAVRLRLAAHLDYPAISFSSSSATPPCVIRPRSRCLRPVVGIDSSKDSLTYELERATNRFAAAPVAGRPQRDRDRAASANCPQFVIAFYGPASRRGRGSRATLCTPLPSCAGSSRPGRRRSSRSASPRRRTRRRAMGRRSGTDSSRTSRSTSRRSSERCSARAASVAMGIARRQPRRRAALPGPPVRRRRASAVDVRPRTPPISSTPVHTASKGRRSVARPLVANVLQSPSWNPTLWRARARVTSCRSTTCTPHVIMGVSSRPAADGLIRIRSRARAAGPQHLRSFAGRAHLLRGRKRADLARYTFAPWRYSIGSAAPVECRCASSRWPRWAVLEGYDHGGGPVIHTTRDGSASSLDGPSHR